MSRRNNKKAQKQTEKRKCNAMLQDCMVEIQAEAYYRAFKKIEQEKMEIKEQVEERKEKWYISLLFALNILFFPWSINKRFNVNNQIYDSVLVFFVSGVLYVIGTFMWLLGIYTIIAEIIEMLKVEITNNLVILFLFGMLFHFFGVIFILAGVAFYKERDSSKIYAYSASVIALISCVVGIIALIKMK